MIIRVFIASIYPDRIDEFRTKFVEISVPATKQAEGLISLKIGEPIGNHSSDFFDDIELGE